MYALLGSMRSIARSCGSGSMVANSRLTHVLATTCTEKPQPRQCLDSHGASSPQTSGAATASSSTSINGALCASLKVSARWEPGACSTSMAAWQPQVRGFASKAAAKAGGDAASSSPKDRFKRRSDNKMWAVRNSRIRSQFEQIWPTLQLSEEELQLFKRSSRVFVTDLGRTISLKQKFELAKGKEAKVPHTEARSLLYESDLHLDAVGEHPRYLKIRRLRGSNFAAKLESVRKLRMLLGAVRRGELQSLYEQSLLALGPDRTWKLVCALEGRLVSTAVRLGLAHDSLAARGALNRGGVWVNGSRPPMPHASFVQPGDVVSVAGPSRAWQQAYVAGQVGPGLMGQLAASWLGRQGPPSGGRFSGDGRRLGPGGGRTPAPASSVAAS